MPLRLSFAALRAYPELEGLSDELVAAVMLGHIFTCKCVLSIAAESGRGQYPVHTSSKG